MMEAKMEVKPKIARKALEARRDAQGASSLPALCRNRPRGHLDLGLLPPRTVRQYVSVDYAASFVLVLIRTVVLLDESALLSCV